MEEDEDQVEYYYGYEDAKEEEDYPAKSPGKSTGATRRSLRNKTHADNVANVIDQLAKI